MVKVPFKLLNSIYNVICLCLL